MKKFLPFLSFVLLLVMSCGRKSVPQKTNNVKVDAGPIVKQPELTKDNTEPALIKKSKVEKEESTETSIEKKEVLLPMIVIDGMGNVITPKEKLPSEIASKADYRVLSRAFTPNQRTNLIYRYKIVPPRILFVPENYIKTSARGKYIVYRKKFWYWQKEDGLFYLDETYYN
ncbi:MAG: hypothetical protein IBJ16_07880 [Chitinophagaceae bacterium]|nr:hypothetical protein [Chitinophagaceae bacterium]